MNSKTKWDTIVVGAGAAGCMAAIIAAEQGQKVLLIEKNEKIGKKIYITGKGRCNITNDTTIDQILLNIPTNPKFLYGALNAFDSRQVMKFFEESGCPVKVERGNRVFPVSDKSSDVIKALENRLKSSGVPVWKNQIVKGLLLSSNEENTKSGFPQVKGLILNLGEGIFSDRVILAMGGLAYPATGSTGDGYVLAQSVGHTIQKTTSGLVPIETVEQDFSDLSPLLLKNVGFQLKKGKKILYQAQGEIQFMKYGLSGALVLSASSYLPKIIGDDIKASIDLKPALSEDKLETRILREVSSASNQSIEVALGSLLPHKMFLRVLSRCQINPKKKVAEMTKSERANLIEVLKNLNFKIKAVRPLTEAIITRGGVSIKEINPKTMESKLVKNLYMVGEMLDVDALTGGFNLQIAFATGYLAGIQPVEY